MVCNRHMNLDVIKLVIGISFAGLLKFLRISFRLLCAKLTEVSMHNKDKI